MNYQAFKNELRNLWFYESELERTEERIENLYHQMSGLKAVSYDSIPSTPNPEVSEEIRLQLSDEIEELDTEKKRLILNIQHIYRTLNMLGEKDKAIVMQILVRKAKAEKIAFENGYSKSGVWARIKREIEKV